MEDLEKRIEMLDTVHVADLELTGVRADKVRLETILKYIEIEGCRAKLASRGDDLDHAKRCGGEKHRKGRTGFRKNLQHSETGSLMLRRS